MSEALPGQGMVLVGRSRSHLCALPLEHVVEAMRPLPITPLTGSPTFIRGLSVIRGVPTPVVDLGALLFGPEPPRSRRFVSLRFPGRRVALALEEVLGVRNLPALEALPPLLGEAQRDRVSGLGMLDQELLLALDAGRLVPESVWLQIERAAR